MPVQPAVVLITGCSSGFGMLAAARLAASGHRVYATMRELGKRADLEQEAKRRGAIDQLHVLQLDVTDPVSIRKAVAEIILREKKIDVLINNAGFGIGGFFEDLSAEDWQTQFQTNFFGVLHVTREVLPVMRLHRRGRVINVSSVSAFSGSPSFSAYVSSKWALEGFSECLFMELKPFHIDVVLLEPGSYRTKIFEDNARYARDFFNERSPYHAMSQGLKMFLDRYIRKSHSDPEDVAKAIERLVNAEHPRFRNIIGMRAKLRCWIVRHVPFEFYAGVLTGILFSKDKDRKG